MNRALVLGLGNDVRRDDGVGKVVATRIAARGLPGVEVRTHAQLLPEMVEWFAEFDLVVIVDATVDGDLCARRAEPVDAPSIMTHQLDPAGLLAMAHQVGAPVPECVVVRVPAFDFAVGEGLSEAAANAADGAVTMVLELLA